MRCSLSRAAGKTNSPIMTITEIGVRAPSSHPPQLLNTSSSIVNGVDAIESAGQREKGLEELRVRIQSLKNENPLSKFREDEFFLLCFLRSRRFDVDRAFRCYQKYYKVRAAHPTIMYPAGIGPLERVKFFELNNVTLQPKRNPIDGSTIYIWRKGDWLPGTDWDLAEHLTPSYWMIEHALREPVVQHRGVQIIIDGDGITWSMLPYIKIMVFKVRLPARASRVGRVPN